MDASGTTHSITQPIVVGIELGPENEVQLPQGETRPATAATNTTTTTSPPTQAVDDAALFRNLMQVGGIESLQQPGIGT